MYCCLFGDQLKPVPNLLMQASLEQEWYSQASNGSLIYILFHLSWWGSHDWIMFLTYMPNMWVMCLWCSFVRICIIFCFVFQVPLIYDLRALLGRHFSWILEMALRIWRDYNRYSILVFRTFLSQFFFITKSFLFWKKKHLNFLLKLLKHSKPEKNRIFYYCEKLCWVTSKNKLKL